MVSRSHRLVAEHQHLPRPATSQAASGYFTGEPLYPFGYGLSYTSFRYDNVRVSATNVAAEDSVTVSADVTNTGPVDSDEVAQLYVSHPGKAGAPVRSLQGFERIHLKRGEKQSVKFVLNDRAMSVVDEAGQRKVEPGRVELWVGGWAAGRACQPGEARGRPGWVRRVRREDTAKLRERRATETPETLPEITDAIDPFSAETFVDTIPRIATGKSFSSTREARVSI